MGSHIDARQTPRKAAHLAPPPPDWLSVSSHTKADEDDYVPTSTDLTSDTPPSTSPETTIGTPSDLLLQGRKRERETPQFWVEIPPSPVRDSMLFFDVGPHLEY